MLERRLPDRSWSAPLDIRLNDDAERLLWRPLGGAHEIRDSAGVLSDFVALAEAQPDRFLRYAQKWGVLMLCEHDLPCTHNPPVAGVGLELGTDPRCRPRRNDPVQLGNFSREYLAGIEYWEPLAAWRLFAQQAAAILNVAAALHLGERGKEADWDLALGNAWRGVPKGDPLFLDERLWEPSMLAEVVNEWLRVGDVRPQMTWRTNREAKILLGARAPGYRLFGAIATQLAFAVARADSLAICSACGQAYTPSKKPRASERYKRHYCDACREDGVPVRDAQRDRRARLRQSSAA